MRHKAADAAAEAALAEQRKAEALRVFDQIGAHQLIAAVLHSQAKAAGADVAFMPAPHAILAVEGRPGALHDAVTVIARFPYLGAPHEAGDTARTIVADSETDLGGSVVAREAAAECREAVARGGNVYELRPRPDYIRERNSAARLRNDGARFLGLKGFRCRCGKSRAGRDGWFCCGQNFDNTIPDAPRGFPLPRISSWNG
jgi:hypothetical protein